jgi:hypothetical protein
MYFSDGSHTIYEIAKPVLLGPNPIEIGIYNSVTLTELILDIETDGNNLFVYTDTSLLIYNTELNEIDSTLNPDIVIEPTFYSVLTNNKRGDYIYYNTLDNYLYIIQNFTEIKKVNIDYLGVVSTINVQNLISYQPTYDALDTVLWSQNHFYYNNDTTMLRCNYITEKCISIFNISDFSLYEDFFTSGIMLWNDGQTKNRFLLSNGYFIENYCYWLGSTTDRCIPAWKIMSGFEKFDEFNDIFELTSLNINKTPEFIGNDVNINVEASHIEGDEYLRYALDCDSSTSTIFKNVFNKNIILNESYGYTNDCNFIVTPDDFGLNEYSLKFTSNCQSGITFDIEKYKLITNDFSFNFKVSQVYDKDFLVELLSDETIYTYNFTDDESTEYLLLGLRFNYNTTNNLLKIYTKNSDELVYLQFMDLSLTPYIYLDRILYDVKLMVDIENDKYRLGIRNYGVNDYTYSDEIEIKSVISTFTEINVLYNNSNNIFDNSLTIKNNSLFYFDFNNSYLNNTDLIHSHINICKYISANKGSPIINPFIIINTTDGLKTTYFNSLILTNTSYNWICSDLYNSENIFNYPDNTIFNIEYYGINCSNCDISTTWLDLGLDNSSNYMINVTLEDDFEIDVPFNITSNLWGYKFIQESNTEGSTTSQNSLFSVEITNEYFPSFVDTNNFTCKYSSIGDYTIIAYLGSILTADYNTKISTSITIVDYEINDIGNMFNDLMSGDDSPYSPSFWKFIMFLAFTISILVGVGMFNGIESYSDFAGKSLDIIWIEFIVSETFMLFIMAKFFGFFPLFYFISIIIIDALTLTYYVVKSFGG